MHWARMSIPEILHFTSLHPRHLKIVPKSPRPVHASATCHVHAHASMQACKPTVPSHLPLLADVLHFTQLLLEGGSPGDACGPGRPHLLQLPPGLLWTTSMRKRVWHTRLEAGQQVRGAHHARNPNAHAAGCPIPPHPAPPAAASAGTPQSQQPAQRATLSGPVWWLPPGVHPQPQTCGWRMKWMKWGCARARIQQWSSPALAALQPVNTTQVMQAAQGRGRNEGRQEHRNTCPTLLQPVAFFPPCPHPSKPSTWAMSRALDAPATPHSSL